MPVIRRTEPTALADDDALVLIDPVFPDERVERIKDDFRASGRPFVTLWPTAATRPADLLIIGFDGLVAQLDEEQSSERFDSVIIGLLRREHAIAPQPYTGWLIRALVNAAVAKLFDGRVDASLSLLDEARTLGPPPDELDQALRRELATDLQAHTLGATQDRMRSEHVQAWLLSE